MRLELGIDTGNTNTDSVLVDLASGNVLQTAKALTRLLAKRIIAWI